MNNRIKIQYTALLLIILFLLQGCGIKLKGAKRGDHASVETFLVGNGVIQYFVKPLSFTAPRNTMLIDFTLRGKQDSLYVAKINFTIGDKATSKIDSYSLVNAGTGEVVTTVRKTSVSKIKTGIRYFADADNIKLLNLFSSGQIYNVITYNSAGETVYHPTKKSAKKIRKIPSLLMQDI